jgi:ribonuclease P protein component
LGREDKLPPRFGFVVSNKISKEATKRNRIKRLMREAVKKLLPEIKEGMNIIFLVRQKLLLKSKEEVFSEVKSALTKAGLTK